MGHFLCSSPPPSPMIAMTRLYPFVDTGDIISGWPRERLTCAILDVSGPIHDEDIPAQAWTTIQAHQPPVACIRAPQHASDEAFFVGMKVARSNTARS
jgi:hypothetical protein